jgi:hypothetical protein
VRMTQVRYCKISQSNFCKSMPGPASSMLTSIIGALHFGQAGRSTIGMMDNRRLGSGMMLVQLYASEGFKRESIRQECQAVVQTFSAKSTRGPIPRGRFSQ